MEKELSLKEIQKEALNVLVFFDAVCKEIGVNYYLAYGTLIGAIRHNGFIPWDDDLDVWMKREDYEKLKEYWIANSEKFLPFRYCSREHTKDYPYYIARISNNQFKYITNLKNGKNPNIGVFIDIYPLDEYGKTKAQGKRIEAKIDKLNMLYLAYFEKRSFTGGFNGFVRIIIHYCMLIIHGKKYNCRVNKRIDKLISLLQCDSQYIGVPGWDTYKKIFDKVLFEKAELHMFEGHLFPIPSRYHEILTEIYGDYMQMPPEEKRNPHHEYRIVKLKENDFCDK